MVNERVVVASAEHLLDSRDFRLREKWAVLQCSLVKEPASCSFTFIDIGFSGTLIRSYWTV